MESPLILSPVDHEHWTWLRRWAVRTGELGLTVTTPASSAGGGQIRDLRPLFADQHQAIGDAEPPAQRMKRSASATSASFAKSGVNHGWARRMLISRVTKPRLLLASVNITAAGRGSPWVRTRPWSAVFSDVAQGSGDIVAGGFANRNRRAYALGDGVVDTSDTRTSSPHLIAKPVRPARSFSAVGS
jgi:hypothetical protein